MNDHEWMQQALDVAQKGRYTTAPNPMVGCILVKDGKKIAEGFHHKAGQAHAEIIALQALGQHVDGVTAYVTLEPCAHQGRTGPCCEALAHAGITRVVVACEDPNPKVQGKGLDYLREKGITVDVGILEDAAKALNAGFFKRMQKGLPYIRLKMAMSLDGRTGFQGVSNFPVTSSAAREDVQHFRAMSGAMVTGVGTVLVDDPKLNVRACNDESAMVAPRQPLRVVLDSRCQTPHHAAILSVEGEALVATTAAGVDNAKQLEAMGHCAEIFPADEAGGVALGAVFSWLAEQEINDVLIEAGPRLAGRALQQQWIDEVILYIAPRFLGDSALPLLQNVPLLSDAAFEIESIDKVGDDVRLILKKRAQ